MKNTKEITLHGGPCNKSVIKNKGQVNVFMGIASPFDTINNRPAVNARIGTAIYETDEEGNAFWLTNKWHGRIVNAEDLG